MTDTSGARPSPEDVRLTEDERRFVLEVEGAVAFISLGRGKGGSLALMHTEVPEELEGRGVGSALVRGALELARKRGVQVLPYCPFVHAYIRRHREYVDLVDPSYPRLDELTE